MHTRSTFLVRSGIDYALQCTDGNVIDWILLKVTVTFQVLFSIKAIKQSFNNFSQVAP